MLRMSLRRHFFRSNLEASKHAINDTMGVVVVSVGTPYSFASYQLPCVTPQTHVH